MRLSGTGAVAAVALLAATAPPAAARPITIDPVAAERVPTQPLLLDMTADLALTGRADRGAAVDLSARCSLRPCLARAVANRRGRWRARLHVVVPPHRTTLFVRAGEATRRVTLASAPPLGGEPELALIGDSLAQGTAPHLPALLPGWRVTADAARSRFLLDGMSILETMRKPARGPVVLAFSLFTNDHPSRAAELGFWARQSLAGLPRGSCAIWATIARPRVDGFSYAEANRLLEQLAAEDEDERIVVVPWARAVREHPEWLRRDRVHATDEGYRARAQLYADAALACQVRSGRSG